MPFNMGWPEILIILFIVLIIFGAGKLPQIGGAFGKSIREFKKAQTGEDETKANAEKSVVKTEDAEKK
jgi:sec-independent protein translocase protein TatA